ncbi:hypothetical protein DMN91_005939 [Ooceraea biroi]|uniref:Uncharacterized protein n=1 Tax=Ooceraea biroi TaxID=2015173 RepID=A0A3L8DMR1_OOCBI|nr:hypothetical protein DMN91_005939 [Ooceraea biroi]
MFAPCQRRGIAAVIRSTQGISARIEFLRENRLIVECTWLLWGFKLFGEWRISLRDMNWFPATQAVL